MKFMKRNLTVLLTTGALVAVLSAGLTFARAQTNSPGTPPAGAVAPPSGAPQRHPAISRAILALKAARSDLEKTPHNFGGHKEAEVLACNKAIAELELALKADTE